MNQFELLNETIYHNDKLKKIDELYDHILKTLRESLPEKVKFIPIDIYDRKVLDSVHNDLNQISKILSEIFNIKCFINLKIEKTTYCMCIAISASDLKKSLNDAIQHINQKTGYTYTTRIRKGKINIQSQFLFLHALYGLPGKNLTAITLHEIGHKFFIRAQERKHNIFEWVYGGSILTAVVSTTVLATVLSHPLLAAMSALGHLAFLSTNNFVYDIIQAKTESLSDSFAVKYGYGMEIFKELKTLADIIQKRGGTTRKVDLRLKYLMKEVKKEINNKENSPEDIRILKNNYLKMKKLSEKVNSKGFTSMNLNKFEFA